MVTQRWQQGWAPWPGLTTTCVCEHISLGGGLPPGLGPAISVTGQGVQSPAAGAVQVLKDWASPRDQAAGQGGGAALGVGGIVAPVTSLPTQGASPLLQGTPVVAGVSEAPGEACIAQIRETACEGGGPREPEARVGPGRAVPANQAPQP